MNYIVLVKQVPDVKNIPNEAWDWEKGTLKRGLLDNVCNEFDKQAIAFALGLREKQNGTVVSVLVSVILALTHIAVGHHDIYRAGQNING